MFAMPTTILPIERGTATMPALPNTTDALDAEVHIRIPRSTYNALLWASEDAITRLYRHSRTNGALLGADDRLIADELRNAQMKARAEARGIAVPA